MPLPPPGLHAVLKAWSRRTDSKSSCSPARWVDCLLRRSSGADWLGGVRQAKNCVDDQTDVVASKFGQFPLSVHITGGRFFTSSGAIWTRLKQ